MSQPPYSREFLLGFRAANVLSPGQKEAIAQEEREIDTRLITQKDNKRREKSSSTTED